MSGFSTTARLALLASITLAACAGNEPVAPPPAKEAPAEIKPNRRGEEPTAASLGGPRDTLVVAYQADVGNMISVVSQSANDSYMINAVYMPGLDSTFDCELKYLPGLFDTWEFSEDSKVLKIKLRNDITWYDGTPVTAKDVKLTFELVRDPLVASPRISSIEFMEPGKDPLVIDDHNVEFHFTRAYDRTTMIAHTASLPVVPAHVLGTADRATLRGNPLAKSALASGSFTIAEWKPNEKIVLVPNDKFSGPDAWKPRLKRVIFKVLPEYATRLVEIENGSADMMEQILVADADRLLKEHPEIKLYRRGWRSQDFLGYNQFDAADYKAKQQKDGAKLDWAKVKPHPIFADRAVRRAIAKAVNVDKMIADLLTSKVSGEAYAKRSVSTVTPALCDIHNNDIVPIAFDLEGARKDLEAAGWVDKDGDGMREKGGVKLAFSLMTNSGNSRRAKGAVIVQANLKEIGAAVDIETIESNTFFERLRKKDYEAALSGWSAALFVDMSTIWHSGETYEFNFVGYQNAEVDRLIDAALAEPDPKKNAVLWKQVQALIYEDQPYTFLYWIDEIVGVHQRFKDVKVNLSSSYDRLDTWWVPDGEVKYPN